MCEAIREKRVKIRKPQTCDGCCKQFPVGTVMDFAVMKADGEIHNLYVCDCCRDYMAADTDGKEAGYSEGCISFPLVDWFDDYRGFAEKWQEQ